jgi:hypothetical protein
MAKECSGGIPNCSALHPNGEILRVCNTFKLDIVDRSGHTSTAVFRFIRKIHQKQTKNRRKSPEMARKMTENQRFLHAFPASLFIYLLVNKGYCQYDWAENAPNTPPPFSCETVKL